MGAGPLKVGKALGRASFCIEAGNCSSHEVEEKALKDPMIREEERHSLLDLGFPLFPPKSQVALPPFLEYAMP
jgi:hypothetical protein